MHGRDIITAGILFALPGISVLAILAALGLIGWPAVLLSVPALVAGTLIVARLVFRDFRRISAYAEALRDGRRAAPPHNVKWDTAAALSSLYTQIAHAGNARLEAATAHAAAAAAILDHLPVPMLLVNDRREVSGYNRAAAHVFKGVAVGRDLTRYLRAPQILDAITRVLGDTQNPCNAELTLHTDVARHYNVVIARLPADSADEHAVVLTFTDLTESRKIERMRADFAADAGHELRTPLSVLLGFIETLEGPAKTDPGALDNFLPVMRDQAERMQVLVEDLLSLARIELNEHTPPSDCVDVTLVLKKVAAGLAVKAGEKSMTIDLVLDTAEHQLIGDQGELGQIFQNLIDNAIKYGRASSKVVVRLSQPDRLPPALERFDHPQVLAVAVCDQGEGIAREHLPRLTERFYRVDAARSRAVGGTGLGLAIVKHLVARHRGVLTIDSTPGEGSQFTVYLPAARQDRRRRSA